MDSKRCEGAVMAANARTFLSLLLIYAVSNVYFQTKTSETHLFGTNNSPTAPRIAIRERNLEYFAVVLYRCGKLKLQLTSTGYYKLPVVAIRWGKRGNTTLAVSRHNPPFEITICYDIALNPGPATSVENRVQPGHQVMIKHRSENLLRAPILTYSRQQLMDLRRQRCFPSSTAITLLKQCGIFKFRRQRGGRYRRTQRHYANFSVCPRPLFHRAVNPGNLVPIKKAPSQAPTPISRFINFCPLNTRSVKNKIIKVKDFVVDHDIDILAMTETWLLPGNIDEVDISTLCPTGYRFFHVFSCLLFKETINVNSQITDTFESFEYMNARLCCLQGIRILVIYRPPGRSSYDLFYEEFSKLIEQTAVSTGGLLIAGDFNLRVDDRDNFQARRFVDILESYNLC